MAVPISLIINELLTNCFKYAIPNVPAPTLSVSFMNRNGLLLEVVDNGPGIDMDLWHRPTTSFGKRLIKGLSEQTGGTLTVENLTPVLSQVGQTGQEQVAENYGTRFRLHIPASNLIR